MQTEIDQFLIEQNALLSQQNNLLVEQIQSLESILFTYSELEENLKQEIKQQNSLISAMKNELTKLEQSSFLDQLQTQLQDKLMNQENLTSIVQDLIQPIQTKVQVQQTQIQTALSKILQIEVPDTFYKDLNMQAEQIKTLTETVDNLVIAVKNLND